AYAFFKDRRPYRADCSIHVLRGSASIGRLELVATQDGGHRAVEDERVERLFEELKLCRSYALARQPDAVGNGFQLAGLAEPAEAFVLDQVPGDVLVDHRQALFAEASACQHAQQLAVVGHHLHLHVTDLPQSLRQDIGRARGTIDTDCAPGEVLRLGEHVMAVAGKHAVARGHQHARDAQEGLAPGRTHHREETVRFASFRQGQGTTPRVDIDPATVLQARAYR